ncbi:hypothetical protein RI367_002110 [Sorochytrium milnesiophthora]
MESTGSSQSSHGPATASDEPTTAAAAAAAVTTSSSTCSAAAILKQQQQALQHSPLSAHMSCLALCTPRGSFLALCLRRDLTAQAANLPVYSLSNYSVRVISCPQKLANYLQSLQPQEQPQHKSAAVSHPSTSRQMWTNRPDDYEVNLGEAYDNAQKKVTGHVVKTFSPPISFVSRYLEGFSTGAHMAVLRRYADALLEGKALTFIDRAAGTWSKRLDDYQKRRNAEEELRKQQQQELYTDMQMRLQDEQAARDAAATAAAAAASRKPSSNSSTTTTTATSQQD